MRTRAVRIGKISVRWKLAGLAALALVAAAFLLAGYLETRSRPQARGVIAEDIGRYQSIEYQGVSYVQKTALQTVLLMGVDQSSQIDRFGARQGGQADLFWLLVIDSSAKTVRQLQLDRDTMTQVQVYGVLGNETGTAWMQLCLSHGFGSTPRQNNQNAVDAVRGFLHDIPIDGFITFRLDAIGVINDALGGVTVTLEDDFTAYDPAMTEGLTLTLNAAQAEIFTRFRMEVGDGTNESRMARQRSFVSAAAAQLKARLEAEPDYLGTLFDQLTNVMTTDLSRNWMIREANAAFRYAVLPAEVLPGEHSVNAAGFMEFAADPDAVMRWIVDTYYRPAQ